MVSYKPFNINFLWVSRDFYTKNVGRQLAFATKGRAPLWRTFSPTISLIPLNQWLKTPKLTKLIREPTAQTLLYFEEGHWFYSDESVPEFD